MSRNKGFLRGSTKILEPLGQQPPGGRTSHNQGFRGMQSLQDGDQSPKVNVSSLTPFLSHPRSIRLCGHPFGNAGACGGHSVGSDQKMHFQEEEEVSSKRGAKEGWLGVSEHGEWALTFCNPPLPPREKMQSQNRDRLADTGKNQPISQNLGYWELSLPPTQVFSLSPQVLFQSLPSKSLSFELSSKKESK